MNHCLFTAHGFRGNADHYSDPRNSFLNDVLDRELGIPITLSLVYIEVGRRLGLQIEGVSFPGHFLVKVPYGEGVVVLDPYYEGISLGVEQLESRLEPFIGDGLEVSAADLLPRFLAGVEKREILARMLRNLKGVYLQEERYEQALRATERILVITPDNARELKDRGDIYRGLDCFRAALADYERYLALSPGASDAAEVRARAMELQGRVARLH